MLSVRLKKEYGDFSFAVEFQSQARKIAVLGASGSGKTLLLKMLSGLIAPEDGFVLLDGRTLYDAAKGIFLPPQEREVGFLFQGYALFPKMTVRENILSGRRSEVSDEALPALFEKFRVEKFLSRYPKSLSGGEKQRTALSRMACSQAKNYFLDEPFSAMDAFLREQLFGELSQLLETQGTSLLVTHSLEEAFAFSDEILILSDGHVAEQGEKRTLFERPGTLSGARLMGVRNISSFERLDAHHGYALDWGRLMLVTEREIPQSTSYVGIRAQELRNVRNPVGNFVPIREKKRWELPFVWKILLDCGLWWETSQREYLPFLELPQEKLLFLEDR